MELEQDLTISLHQIAKNICIINGASYEYFNDVFAEILDKHAPVKIKLVGANDGPFMTKHLRKLIMERSKAKNRYNKKGHLKNRTNTEFCEINGYKKQKGKSIIIYLDDKKKAGIIMMDLFKAFDCLSHDLLIAKLHAYGFSKQSLMLLQYYLKERTQRVKINSQTSTLKNVTQEVPQG